MTRATEGFVPFRGYRTWYRVVGDLGTDAVPLLLLHGGPGGPSAAFEPLESLADAGRPVIRYDQLGCGRSDRPQDTTLWTVETFVDELATVRRELGLDRVHLLGWSWGGMLALEYMFTKPAGVVSLVLTSSPANIPLWVAECRRLREDLSEPTKTAMRRFEENYRPRVKKPSPKVKPGPDARKLETSARMLRTISGVMLKPSVQRLAARASAIPFLRRAAYEVVGFEFMRRHVCRLDPPFPMALYRSLAGMGRPVYETMWGPSEFFATGPLKEWNVVSRLGEIDVPTLITSGRHDEATPKQMEEIRDGIPGAEWVVFEESSHSALYEEPARYRAVLTDFLDKVDARSA